MRLRRSNPERPGIRRQRRGRGFTYLGPDGSTVSKADRERIDALVIPPAWDDVWICLWPHGHIQAVGTDEAGRRQYVYHPEWTRSRSVAKHARARDLARALPAVRGQIEQELQTGGLGRERVLAGALRMMDAGTFRTGGEEYAKTHGSYGVATMLREHAHVHGTATEFEFPAKSGQVHQSVLEDAPTARLIGALKRARGGSDRLLRYVDDDGWHDVTGADLNAALKAMAGEEYTVKDLRTWAATVLAALTLAGHDAPRTARERTAQQRAVCVEVSEQLGNTVAVARRAYIDPLVFDAHEQGLTVREPLLRSLSGPDRARLRRGRTAEIVDQRPVERAVLRLLDRVQRG